MKKNMPSKGAETKKIGLKHRYAIKMLGKVHDTILPEGWIGVNHVSGAVVYLHRETRVVTWSRPYSISRETSLKKHNIPLMSIPCLHQKLAMGYLPRKEGKRACPIDNEACAKLMKMDEDISENNIESEGGDTVNSKSDTNVTNIPFPKCNGIEHSTEIIETISSCTDMDVLSEDSEMNDVSKGIETNAMVDVNNANETVSISDCFPASEKLDSMPSFNEPGPLLETNSDVRESLESIETISCMDVHSQEMCDEVEESEESVDVTFCRNRKKESLETYNDTSCANGMEASKETGNVTSCPYIIAESQEACNLTFCGNGIEESEKICNINSCAEGIQESLETGNITSCADGIQKSLETGNVTSCATGVEETQETNDAISTSNNIGESTELDLLGNGSDDSTESVDSNEITPTCMHNYLGNIFEFDIQTAEQGNLPILSFECPEQPEYVEDINIEKKFITDGKTPFQILNEYCQKELKALPSASKIERHSQHDFTVEVLIKTLKFGIASGDTLRQAKHNAAACTLNIFDNTVLNEEETSSYLMVFDKIPCDDKAVLPTIEEFSAMGVKYPYEILVHLLTRNFSDFNESEIEFNVENIDGGLKKYLLKYKEYKAEGVCESWKQVKQVAAQSLIQVVYPDLKNWGSVIRLMEAYTTLTTNRELDTENKLLKPSKCIIHVLRQEMRKIAGNLSV